MTVPNPLPSVQDHRDCRDRQCDRRGGTSARLCGPCGVTFIGTQAL